LLPRALFLLKTKLISCTMANAWAKTNPLISIRILWTCSTNLTSTTTLARLPQLATHLERSQSRYAANQLFIISSSSNSDWGEYHSCFNEMTGKLFENKSRSTPLYLSFK
jgi:hypothetical protein